MVPCCERVNSKTWHTKARIWSLVIFVFAYYSQAKLVSSDGGHFVLLNECHETISPSWEYQMMTRIMYCYVFHADRLILMSVIGAF